MKKSLLPLLLLTATMPALAQTDAAKPAEPAAPVGPTLTVSAETRAALVKLGGQLMIDGKAYEYDRQLADEIGPRLTGSANYVKATEWAKAEFTRLGLKNVHFEPWTIPATWEPETVGEAHILKPHYQRLHVESEGWTPSTPAGGVKGEVVHLDTPTVEAIKKDADKLKGKIVLVDKATFRSGPKEYGKIFDGLDTLKGIGVKGMLLGMGTTNDSPSFLGLTDFNGSLYSLPTGNVGEEDTLLLSRLLAKGPVEVEFEFRNKIRENVTVNNVVAEIPGTDNSGEYIVIGGHLDSWHPGTGAQDNGTGASGALATAEAIVAAGLKPKRTIRFILFGGEEEGLIGSVQYVRAHVGEMDKCAGVFINDTGSDAPNGLFVYGREDVKKSLGEILPLLSSIDATKLTDGGGLTFSTDNGPFVIHGVPTVVLSTPFDKYMKLHHKPSDTFDKVDQRDLNLGVTAVALAAYEFADSATSLHHYTDKEVEDQLKQIQAYDEYKDMVDHKLF